MDRWRRHFLAYPLQPRPRYFTWTYGRDNVFAPLPSRFELLALTAAWCAEFER
jgi:hypothetical protein